MSLQLLRQVIESIDPLTASQEVFNSLWIMSEHSCFEPLDEIIMDKIDAMQNRLVEEKSIEKEEYDVYSDVLPSENELIDQEAVQVNVQLNRPIEHINVDLVLDTDK